MIERPSGTLRYRQTQVDGQDSAASNPPSQTHSAAWALSA